MYRVLALALCASMTLSGCHIFHHRPPPQRVAVSVDAPAAPAAEQTAVPRISSEQPRV